MKSRSAWKRQSRVLQAGYKAVPNQRNTYTTQIKGGFTHGEMMELPALVGPVPYNADGSRKFLVGYSVIGGPDKIP
jgi:hypothetical protein